ncbi:hypothetical protein [Micavibrio aeruginosavorus]|uniref:hypothetical protein n=1 Tax=Micavibrio aeruginosavorus TaxID=349221 RepID=UPI003F4AC4B6
MPQHNTPNTPPVTQGHTQDGQALIKGAKAGLLLTVGATLCTFAFVGAAIGVWVTIAAAVIVDSVVGTLVAFGATAATMCGSLTLGQYACKRGEAAWNALPGYGVTKMVGAVAAPIALAFGLAHATPHMIPAPIKTAFNEIAQKREAARMKEPQNTQQTDQTNTDGTDVSGPSDNLIYVLESKDCDSESAKEMERFLTEQKTVFMCLPKFVP